MAENSKFSGLADLRNPLMETAPASSTPVTRQTATREGGGGVMLPQKVKYVGKRNNPDYKQCAVLLKVVSQEEAQERLRKQYKGSDFSELMQALLDQWLKLD